MWKTIKTYLPFATNEFQKYLAYKANVIIFVIGDGLILLATFFLWKAIYQSSPESIIKGFSYTEMIIYVAMSFTITSLIYTDAGFTVSAEVKDGSIAMNLIRPINFQTRMLFQSIGNLAYNFIVVFLLGATIITIYTLSLGFQFSLPQIICFILSLLFGFFLNFYFIYAFGLLAFKLTNTWGLNQIMTAVFNLLSGMLIPITFFPEWAQPIFTILPFSSIIYSPTMIYLGKFSTEEMVLSLVLQLFWIFILSLLVKWLWNILIKHLVILGG